MSSKLKTLAKDSAIYGLGEGISRLSGIILIPILSRIFLPSDYGVIDLLSLSYSFVLIAISLNIYSGLQKFYYQRSGEERKILVTSTILFRFLFSLLVGLAFFVSAGWVSRFAFNREDYAFAIQMLAIVLPIEDVFQAMILVLRLNRRAFSFSFYNIMQVIILPITTYACVVNLRMGLNGVFIAKLVTTSVLVAALLASQRREFTRRISFREVIDLTAFSLPGLVAIALDRVMGVLPRYLLVYYSTLASVGLLGMADRIARIVDMYRSSFNLAWNPFAYSNAGKEDEIYLYEKVFKSFAVSLMLLVLILALFAKEALWVMTPPQYHSAAPLVGGFCLYHALKGLALVYSTGLYSVNRVAYTSFLATIKVVVFVISAIILVPAYHAAGMVISLVISAVIHLLCYALTIKRHFPFRFSSQRLLLIAAIAVSGWIFYSHGDRNAAFSVGVVLSKMGFILVFCAATYVIAFTRQERRAIQGKMASLVGAGLRKFIQRRIPEKARRTGNDSVIGGR
jgi:O-antigen/teichoic acid export membrane protein